MSLQEDGIEKHPTFQTASVRLLSKSCNFVNVFEHDSVIHYSCPYLQPIRSERVYIVYRTIPMKLVAKKGILQKQPTLISRKERGIKASTMYTKKVMYRT